MRRLGLPLLLGDFGGETPLRALRLNDESFLEGFLFDPAEANADIDGMVPNSSRVSIIRLFIRRQRGRWSERRLITCPLAR